MDLSHPTMMSPALHDQLLEEGILQSFGVAMEAREVPESMIAPQKVMESLAKKRLTTGSQIEIYRSVLNDLPILAIFFVIGTVSISIAVLLEDRLLHQLGYSTLGIIVVVIAVAALALLAVLMFRRFNVRYIISAHGVRSLSGYLSNTQIEAALEHSQIRGTEIRRNVMQRLVGIGDLIVRGSGTDETEVAFLGVFDPTLYQKVINALHHQSRESIN